MNKLFRIVWSAIRGAFIVAHEKANTHGKPSSTRRGAATALMTSLLAGSGLVLAAPPVNTLPTGGQIVGGATAGTIATNGNAMTINQVQQRIVANWDSYSIGQKASVHYQQPTGGVALNRVTGSQPSEIYGKLTATGDVYLINANGVMFGRTAQVDVGALVASTANISDADFMAGKAKFARNGATGKIDNEGQLTAGLGGYIALLAPEVRNSGVILAQLGTVVLAAGEAVELQFDSGRLANVRVDPSTIATLIDNKNAVLAPGGLIILSAQAASKLQGAAIKNSGTLDASSLTMKGGRIVLEASSSVENTGTITAAGNASHAGGQVEITAPQVVQNGTVDVSGSTGGSVQIKANDSLTMGGQILAKGLVDRGGDVRLLQAQTLSLQPGSRIDVSGNTQGGTVYAESANAIKVEGSIDASSTNGSGGSIELAAGTEAALNNATLDASGATQGGTIRISARTTTHTSLVDPSNPINDPTAPPQDRPHVAVTGTSALRSSSRSGRGGKVVLTGDDLLLGAGSSIDATGATGGGEVLVGGDWQGSNGVYQASTVNLEKGAKIDASATLNGDGGKVVLWATLDNPDSRTIANGTILAKGGAEGGNGGKIETSAATVDIGTSAAFNTLAPKGKTGLWLIDPYDYTIDATAAQSIASALRTTNVDISTASHVASYGSDGNSGSTGNIAVNSAIAAIGLGNIALTNGGSGYVTPTVTISGGGGSGATAIATVSGGVVTGITLTNAGSGYTSAPTISLSGGGGSGATATATVSGGVVNGFSLTNAGSNYTVPTVTINGGGGTGATATATITDGVVTGIIITGAGSGYTSAPTISITGGGGANATATPTLMSNPYNTALSMTAASTIYVNQAITVGALNLSGSSSTVGIQLAADITTQGAQAYSGKVQLAGNITLGSASGGVSFNNTIDALAAAQLLTSGTSWTIPTGVTSVDVWAIGGGGGGGGAAASLYGGGILNSGGGGSAGSVAYIKLTTSPSTSITYAVGAAGSAGWSVANQSASYVNGGVGGTGGSTTVTYGATTLTANGGYGGNPGFTGGSGGAVGGSTATGGTTNVTGGNSSGGNNSAGGGGGALGAALRVLPKAALGVGAADRVLTLPACRLR